MDTEVDEALIELLKLKNYDYIGIDVRIRAGKSTEFFVASREDLLPENDSDDDISRLKEKLELLKQIDALLSKLEKYDKDTEYVPYVRPFVAPPNPYPYNPWPHPPWHSPFWYGSDSNADESIKINWSISEVDGKPLWW